MVSNYSLYHKNVSLLLLAHSGLDSHRIQYAESPRINVSVSQYFRNTIIQVVEK